MGPAADTGAAPRRPLSGPAAATGDEDRAVRGAALGVFLAALALYLVTLAPTVGPVDSGELTLAAAGLGVAHPPGFPLWVLLAHVATRLPWGSFAERANLFSAGTAALAAGLFTLACGALLRGLTAPPVVMAGRRQRGRKAAATEVGSSSGSSVWLRAAAAAAAGLLLALSHALWSFATVAEVYALNTLLLAAILALLLGWRAALPQRRAAATADSRWLDVALPLAGLLFGLGLGVHHVSLILALPGLAVLVLGAAGWRLLRRPIFALTAGLAVAGLVGIYLWLPLAAARQPAMNWGNPVTLERLWWHLTGRQYQAYFSAAPTVWGREAGAFGALLIRQLGSAAAPLAAALVGLGAVELWRRDRSALAGFGLIVAADFGFGLVYEIAEDKEAYYLPAIVALLLVAGVGAATALRWANRSAAPRGRRAVVAVALLLLPGLALAGNFAVDDRRRDFIAHDYVGNTLATVASGGLVLTADWQLVSPLLYRRELEGFRRDVLTVDLNLLRRSWYLDSLVRSSPDSFARLAGPLAELRADLIAWERDPGRYQRDAGLTRRLGERFTRLIVELVRTHPGPRYLTADALLDPDETARAAVAELVARFSTVPQGLVFELVDEPGFHPPAWPRWSLRGLADDTVVLAPGEAERQKILPTYVTMLVNRGRYLAAYGHVADAARAFREAQALDPASPLAGQGLAALGAP